MFSWLHLIYKVMVGGMGTCDSCKGKRNNSFREVVGLCALHDNGGGGGGGRLDRD